MHDESQQPEESYDRKCDRMAHGEFLGAAVHAGHEQTAERGPD